MKSAAVFMSMMGEVLHKTIANRCFCLYEHASEEHWVNLGLSRCLILREVLPHSGDGIGGICVTDLLYFKTQIVCATKPAINHQSGKTATLVVMRAAQ